MVVIFYKVTANTELVNTHCLKECWNGLLQVQMKPQLGDATQKGQAAVLWDVVLVLNQGPPYAVLNNT